MSSQFKALSPQPKKRGSSYMAGGTPPSQQHERTKSRGDNEGRTNLNSRFDAMALNPIQNNPQQYHQRNDRSDIVHRLPPINTQFNIGFPSYSSRSSRSSSISSSASSANSISFDFHSRPTSNSRRQVGVPNVYETHYQQSIHEQRQAGVPNVYEPHYQHSTQRFNTAPPSIHDQRHDQRQAGLPNVDETHYQHGTQKFDTALPSYDLRRLPNVYETHYQHSAQRVYTSTAPPSIITNMDECLPSPARGFRSVYIFPSSQQSTSSRSQHSNRTASTRSPSGSSFSNANRTDSTRSLSGCSSSKDSIDIDKLRSEVEISTKKKYTVVSNTKLQTLEKQAKAYKDAIKPMNRKKYHSSSESESNLYAAAALCNPKSSFAKSAQTIHLSNAAFAKGQGILDDGKVCSQSIAQSSPGETALKNMSHHLAATSIFDEREEILEGEKNGYKSFLGLDKGQNSDFVKLISRYDPKERCVNIFILDNEKSGGTNEEAGHAVKHSIERLRLGEHFRFAGFTSDSGGGGTREKYGEILVQGSILDIDSLVGTCAIHCLQTLLGAPIGNIMKSGQFKKICTDSKVSVLSHPTLSIFKQMKGGVENRNGLQFIHAIYDLQNKVGMTVWRGIIREVCEEKGIPFVNPFRDDEEEKEFIAQLQAPVLTRWWTVGKAARMIVNNWEVLRETVFRCIEMKRKDRDEAMSKISNRLISLFCEDAIISDVWLIHCYNEVVIVPSLKFLQIGDERCGGTPGFIGRLMDVRYFILRNKLQTLMENDNWMNDATFYSFYETFEDDLDKSKIPTEISEYDFLLGKEVNGDVVKMKQEDDRYENMPLRDLKQEPLDPIVQVCKCRVFLEMGLDRLDTHFDRYLKERMFLGLFGEPKTAEILAKKILNPQDQCCLAINASEAFTCKYQKEKINLHKYAKHLDERFEALEITDPFETCTELNSIGRDKISLIASGESIWDKNVSEEAQEIKELYLKKYVAWMTTTHAVEASVKKSKVVRNSARSSLRQTHFMQGQNIISKARKMASKWKEKEWKAKQSNENKPKTGFIPRGKNLSYAVMCVVNDMTEKVDRLLIDESNKEIFNAIKRDLANFKDSFDNQKEENDLNEFRERGLERRGKTKATNLARKRGVELHGTLSGRFSFSRLRKDAHFNMLKKEFEKRELTGSELEKKTAATYRDYKTILKYDEIRKINKWNMTILETIEKVDGSNTQQEDEIKIPKSFRPLHGKVEDWEYKITKD